MKRIVRAAALAAFTSILASTASAAEVKGPVASSTCEAGESWSLGDSIPAEYVETFNLFLGKKLSPVRAFAEGLALRKDAKTPTEKYFAEYWISRALYSAKLVHIARDGLTVLAARPISDATAGVQLAAVGCLIEIKSRYPSLPIQSNVVGRLDEYATAAKKIERQPTFWNLATIQFIAEIGKGRVSTETANRYLAYLEGSNAQRALAEGLIAAQKSNHSDAIREFRKFIASDIPRPLKRYVDTAHLLTARALYSVGQFDAASADFKMITKSSNELANSLQELAWAYLMDEKYSEAIGTAMNLQAGGLRNTFTPEAPMVMAMAMNEICQYPESVRATNVFKKNYESSYRWLEKWNASDRQDSLYKKAVQYLRKAGDVPTRVASEWVRSPLFISNQDEINLIFDERDSTASLGRSGSSEQLKSAQQILAMLKELKPRLQSAREKLKPGQDLPVAVQTEVDKLRLEVTRFRRLQRAAPFWKSVLTNYQANIPKRERSLASEIDKDLKSRSERMYEQIEEIAENIQLIEVEIYNGASEDIIWQNAHPEYKKMAKELAKNEEAPSRSKVWDWGRHPAYADDAEGGEIWEDELGSFKADLVDNCSSKDRYLSLKSRPGAARQSL